MCVTEAETGLGTPCDWNAQGRNYSVATGDLIKLLPNWGEYRQLNQISHKIDT